MKYSDEILLKGIREGSDATFRILFDLYYDKLFCIAWQYVQDHFIADTLVGDLFYHLWESRASLEINSSLNSYLIRAIRNASLNYLQKNYVNREVNIHTVPQLFLSEDYPLGALLEKELDEQIRQEINRLPSETRRVFIMSRLEELKYTEIAERLGLSVNTVKYHIKQALSILREKLKDCLLFFFL